MSVQQMFFATSGGAVAPIGLIVPYTSASTPAGWTSFSSADGRFIVGAGSSYSAGATGGSTSVSVSGATSSAGSHNPTNTGQLGYSGPTPNTSSAGAHTHPFSISGITAQDVYKDFRLIKATAKSKIPANAILFGATSLADLTNTETSTDRFLRANSSYGGTGGSSSFSGSATTGSSGAHNHGSRNQTSNPSNNPPYPHGPTGDLGGHTHTASLSGTLNTKRRYLSAWTNAAKDFNLVANGIAMWESATPPDGWYICNGANGTPDMRDYFVRVGTTGNHGTASGDNNAPWSVSASGNAPHSHINTTAKGDRASPASHGSYAWPHSHAGSGSTAITPPYYALYFVQFAG